MVQAQMAAREEEREGKEGREGEGGSGEHNGRMCGGTKTHSDILCLQVRLKEEPEQKLPPAKAAASPDLGVKCSS